MNEGIQLHARAEREPVDAGHAAAALAAECRADVAAGTSQIEHAGPGRDRFDRGAVRAEEVELRLIVRVVRAAGAQSNRRS